MSDDSREALLVSFSHFSSLGCGAFYVELRGQVDALPPAARVVCLAYLGQLERATRDLTVAPPSSMCVLLQVPEPLRGHLLAFAELARTRAEAASIERALLARLRTPPKRPALALVRDALPAEQGSDPGLYPTKAGA